ncbi:UV-endonuclease UvdE-domain-containing protein [Durotheca rogersii]|uniref:UV-endonuclease UvdE-domain-containing protein n=1 Tax=Durotheca rogersii TaxID=419775 RepID=UPI0022200F89|nr:UV-endonuclease UvdE-domain-containing protein [Durotheca rogersii]KAI5859505.1 UV-endonuclease UvdE-domain-containing protein [Durotheca rogersii]
MASTAAPPPAETQLQRTAHAQHPTTTTTTAPRRSGRLAQNQARQLPPPLDAGPFGGRSVRSASTKAAAETEAKVKKKKKKKKKEEKMGEVGEVGEVAADVYNGRRGLEDRLRDSVKRQKLALDESEVLAGTGAESAEPAALPKVTKRDAADVTAPEPAKRVRKSKKRDLASSNDDRIADAYADGELHDREDGYYDVAWDDRYDDMAWDDADAGAWMQDEARPPPVNSDYLPLPWKGRLGYACLNTYLRHTQPSVFSSRTCRIASILEHRHPLRDPTRPEHARKNRPDKTQPADLARGQRFVEALGLANARDIVKMLRWNDRYGIKFMRLSSEMFPFASHEVYGYRLAPFASETLAEAGRVAAELGHRLTVHPGQYTQLASPREEVLRNSVRDLVYHDEMLSLLQLPAQLDRDAVMVLHMGGTYGNKAATLARFRRNYAALPPGVRARLVLENDDVAWSVHDLLPLCEELGIPLVLDFHHHNIVFDRARVREGSRDLVPLLPRIRATWAPRGITPKMHYSEPRAGAVTPRQRRRHSPRVATLPPCPPDTDLMIEAKDKEQAVFDLMRKFRLPGWDRIHDVVPHERADENPPPPKKSRWAKKRGDDDEAGLGATPPPVPDAEVGMGGPDNRVYWPVGMEAWLRPKKREVKRKKGSETAKKEKKDEDED